MYAAKGKMEVMQVARIQGTKVHMHVKRRSRGYIIKLAWEGGGARKEVGTSSFQRLLFTPAFHRSLMLRLLCCGPSGPSKQTKEEIL